MPLNPQNHQFPVYADETSDDIIWAMRDIAVSETPYGIIGNILVTREQAECWTQLFEVYECSGLKEYPTRFVELPLNKSIMIATMMSDESKNT